MPTLAVIDDGWCVFVRLLARAVLSVHGTELRPSGSGRLTPDFGAAALKGSDEQRDLSCNLRSRKLSRSGESHSIPEQPHSNQPVQSGLVSAFANPQPGTYGSAPRALEVRGPMRLDESFAFKQTKIGERLINQFRVEIQNPLNRVVFGNPIMDFTNAAFGRINSTAVGPRNIQLGMKLIF